MSIQPNIIKWIVSIAALIAALVSIIMMRIALDHNPMGEYCEWPDIPNAEQCDIQWGRLLLLGAIWFTATFTVASLIETVGIVVFKFVFKRTTHSDRDN
jgi:hypothetical protein